MYVYIYLYTCTYILGTIIDPKVFVYEVMRFAGVSGRVQKVATEPFSKALLRSFKMRISNLDCGLTRQAHAGHLASP